MAGGGESKQVRVSMSRQEIENDPSPGGLFGGGRYTGRVDIEWDARAEDTLRRLLLQLDKREREGHEARAREAAEVHARAHGLSGVNPDAATVGFVKAASTVMKPQVKNALRRVGIDPQKYEDFF